ncbi:ScbR family autoregulator-binding transcription factor [Mycobacterium sp.]|uniref:ScbR family autoregulator-binding transcription factor n=1 Tax=Mycobacterium sp. TaxID=1785 RepID=UPI002BD49F85|nr:ScbR family autoregulator-binding transcription factor [Mycobacterium sp.]HKP42060.1 ScbR family autoregulator-binding transcription factor [Mycobacterium sp.]
MVRQARSEATRRKIITSAVEVFNEIGYPAAGLGDIIERAEMTKGALYYHFDSKEALATAIIEEASANLMNAFQGIAKSSAPALEGIIHGVFVVADQLSTDKVARSGTYLLRAFGEFNDAAARTYAGWVTEMTASTVQAVAEGDLRADLDAQAVSETIVAAMLGAELLSNATAAGADVLERVARTWTVLLPAIVSAESLPYFCEFLARESLRQSTMPLAE